jgi:hypothetical protein
MAGAPRRLDAETEAQSKSAPPVRARPIRLAFGPEPGAEPYFRWRDRCLFISNMEHLSVPKIFFSLSSARISRLLFGF